MKFETKLINLSMNCNKKKNMAWFNSDFTEEGKIDLETFQSLQEDKDKTEAEKPQGIPVHCVRFNMNQARSHYMVTVDEKSSLKLWDWQQQTVLEEESGISKGLLATCSIDPCEGRFVACGGIDGKIHVYNFMENTNFKKKKVDQTLKVLSKSYEFSGHQSLVTCSGFLDSSHLVSGSDDAVLFLWDFEKPGRYLCKYTDHSSEINCLDVFNRDGNLFATGSNDTTIRVWDIRMREAAIRIFDKNDCGITAIKFMPDNINTIAVGRDESSINLLDLRTLGLLAQYKEDKNVSAISSMEFSRSGRILFSCSANLNTMNCWDIINEKQICSFGSDTHKDGIKTIALARDGQTLCTGGK